MKKLTFFFLATMLLLGSCSKEKPQQSTVNEKIAANRAKIREQIKLHSAGLRYFYNALDKVQIKTKGGDPTQFPNGPLAPNQVKTHILSFLEENNIEETKELAILYPAFIDQNTNVVSSLDLQFQFSANFYQIALDIINVGGLSLNQINSNIDQILNSSNFIALSEIEQNILIAGAETFIDSYVYWSGSSTSWNTMAVSYRGENNVILTKGGEANSLEKIARADAVGAIAGAIGGAVGGGVVGFLTGGPYGSGLGAIAGFIGGAISGGISNSILTYMNNVQMLTVPLIAEEDVLVGNLEVPVIWTKVVFDANTTVPTHILFQNGLITPSY